MFSLCTYHTTQNRHLTESKITSLGRLFISFCFLGHFAIHILGTLLLIFVHEDPISAPSYVYSPIYAFAFFPTSFTIYACHDDPHISYVQNPYATTYFSYSLDLALPHPYPISSSYCCRIHYILSLAQTHISSRSACNCFCFYTCLRILSQITLYI